MLHQRACSNGVSYKARCITDGLYQLINVSIYIAIHSWGYGILICYIACRYIGVPFYFGESLLTKLFVQDVAILNATSNEKVRCKDFFS